MSKKLRFCFKVFKGKEIYVCIKREEKTYMMPRNRYKKIQEKLRKEVAVKNKCSIHSVVAITLNEYLDKIEETK